MAAAWRTPTSPIAAACRACSDAQAPRARVPDRRAADCGRMRPSGRRVVHALFVGAPAVTWRRWPRPGWLAACWIERIERPAAGSAARDDRSRCCSPARGRNMRAMLPWLESESPRASMMARDCPRRNSAVDWRTRLARRRLGARRTRAAQLARHRGQRWSGWSKRADSLPRVGGGRRLQRGRTPRRGRRHAGRGRCDDPGRAPRGGDGRLHGRRRGRPAGPVQHRREGGRRGARDGASTSRSAPASAAASSAARWPRWRRPRCNWANWASRSRRRRAGGLCTRPRCANALRAGAGAGEQRTAALLPRVAGITGSVVRDPAEASGGARWPNRWRRPCWDAHGRGRRTAARRAGDRPGTDAAGCGGAHPEIAVRSCDEFASAAQVRDWALASVLLTGTYPGPHVRHWMLLCMRVDSATTRDDSSGSPCRAKTFHVILGAQSQDPLAQAHFKVERPDADTIPPRCRHAS